jgi:hypothetical protein
MFVSYCITAQLHNPIDHDRKADVIWSNGGSNEYVCAAIL